MNDSFQRQVLKLQTELQLRLRGVRDNRKAMIYGLRKSMDIFGTREAVIACIGVGRPASAYQVFTIPLGADWDQDLLTRYLRGERPEIPPHMLLAPIKRHGQHWACLGLRDEGVDFTGEHVSALFGIAQALTNIIEDIDLARARSVRRKIEQKIARHEEPRDLIYDLLHGLRSLTRYDHSASLFISRNGDDSVTLVAEQIAWTKAKSQRVGQNIELERSAIEIFSKENVLLCEHVGDNWISSRGDGANTLAQVLEYGRDSRHRAPRESAMVCAPVKTPDGTLGILKISACQPGVLGKYEASLVEDFMPLASLAIQFSVHTEFLRERILQSERKHVLANLARGIAHDVNNSLGAMLPLVQQMRHDITNKSFKNAIVVQDLRHLEDSIQTCRRIFGGMLNIARESGNAVGHGNLRRAIDAALSVLEQSMRHNEIAVMVTCPDEIPMIRGEQGNLTQIFLNIFTNARDAMPSGGKLEIEASLSNTGVEVIVADTGSGIPESELARIYEPFFTTKPEGNGLGLAICRAIIWDVGGDMQIRSEVGRGTTVIIELPVASHQGLEAAE